MFGSQSADSIPGSRTVMRIRILSAGFVCLIFVTGCGEETPEAKAKRDEVAAHIQKVRYAAMAETIANTCNARLNRPLHDRMMRESSAVIGQNAADQSEKAAQDWQRMQPPTR